MRKKAKKKRYRKRRWFTVMELVEVSNTQFEIFLASPVIPVLYGMGVSLKDLLKLFTWTPPSLTAGNSRSDTGYHDCIKTL